MASLNFTQVGNKYESEELSGLDKDTVLELKCGEDGILSFEESQKDFKRYDIGFAVLGVFLYLCAVMGVFSLILKAVKTQKRKKEKRK